MHRGGEAVEPVLGHGSEKLGFLTKVAIGRRVRDSRAAGHFTKGEFPKSPFPDQSKRGLKERIAEVAVMIRFAIGHEISMADMLTEATFKEYDVDIDNIGVRADGSPYQEI
jgi:hypothetical protein